MVKLSKIYTRGGDKGQTGLADGSRVAKNDPRIAAFGSVDEANAAIGLVRLHLSGDEDAMLARIQNDLFDLGADLATPLPERGEYPALRVNAAQVVRLEREIDAMTADLQNLDSFILPGGSPAAAHLHAARTITRRAEREAVAFAQNAEVNEEALKYLNRLSDFLFQLSRRLNDNGARDVLWVPGANRDEGE
jgi:cob(I)alamin adenosyltransferase